MDLQKIKRGLVCFTFDDARYDQWLPLLDLFQEYRVHGSFFFHGGISGEAVHAMKTLREAGHTVGLHSLQHCNALPFFTEKGGEEYVRQQISPQLDICRENGIGISCFAYPNNIRSEETDRFLMEKCHFRHFRAGVPSHPPKGFRIAEEDAAYLELDQIAATPALGGCGIGEYYASTQENLDSALERAAEENKLLVFFSHGISMSPGMVDVHTEMLEKCFAKAASLGIIMPGIDELP